MTTLFWTPPSDRKRFMRHCTKNDYMLATFKRCKMQSRNAMHANGKLCISCRLHRDIIFAPFVIYLVIAVRVRRHQSEPCHVPTPQSACSAIATVESFACYCVFISVSSEINKINNCLFQESDWGRHFVLRNCIDRAQWCSQCL